MQLFKKILFIVLCCTIVSAQQREVKFILNASNMGTDSLVFISGNHPLLGNWDPAKVPLNKVDTNMFSLSLFFDDGENLEYKFTLGNWGKEAVFEAGIIPPNLNLKVKSDTTLQINVPYWSHQFESKLQGQVTGIVERISGLGGDKLPARDLLVWLPPNYYEDTTAYFPVLYMHDGQNLFDPSSSTFGIDWQIDETADSLIRQGIIEPIIIVGIEHTPLRMSEYTYNDTGRLYIDYVANTVKPLIDRKFRTLPGREHTATGGSSAGGLISFILVWEYDHIFSKAVCLSPAFKINQIDFVKEVQNYDGEKKQVSVYIDNGGVGIDNRLQPGINEMLDVLDSKGYIEGEDYFWFFDEDAEHSERAWAKRIWRPLKIFFGKNDH